MTVLKFHFDTILLSINRKIRAKQSLKNLYKIIVKDKIHPEIFIEAHKAIRDFRIVYGREIIVKKDKQNVLKEITITFTHFGALRFHLCKISNINASDSFHKKFKMELVVMFALTMKSYKVLTKTVNVELFYKVTNKYGIVCSY